jgi:hypothetical protein
MVRRKAEASELPPSERRAFYGRFSRETRLPALEALAKRHKATVAELRVPRQASWAEFIEQRALSGDPDARQMLAEMVPAPPLHDPGPISERSHQRPNSPKPYGDRLLPMKDGTGMQSTTLTAIREDPASKPYEPDIVALLTLLKKRKDRSK